MIQVNQWAEFPNTISPMDPKAGITNPGQSHNKSSSKNKVYKIQKKTTFFIHFLKRC
jgi:hypothetical protein